VQRPAAIAVCSVLLATGAMAWHLWRAPTFTHDYATERGQRRNATLPDGSELVLDAGTRTGVALYHDRREVRLAEGQAMFSVAPDAGRPFRVLAGPARITVVGTRFSVRYSTTGSHAGTVQVAVEHGMVAVDGAAQAPSAGGTSATTVGPGQAVQISATGAVGTVASIPPGSVALWRKGLVHFSDTPLSQAIQEMERYGPTGLVVRDPAIADLRIGGSYASAHPAELAKVLPSLLPVRLVPRGDGTMEVVGTR